jgi:hypothetical protein
MVNKKIDRVRPYYLLHFKALNAHAIYCDECLENSQLMNLLRA